jgi:hypothetical protein
MGIQAGEVSPVDLAAIIGGASLVLSLIGSAAIAGYRVGKVEEELRSKYEILQSGTTSVLNTISDRLARIEGMFELRLKD